MRKKHISEKIQANFDGREITYEANAVSRGIGIGKTLCFFDNKKQIKRYRIEDSQIKKEVERFQKSTKIAQDQLNKIASPEFYRVGKNQKAIFETHLLFLKDRSLLRKIEKTITEQKVNAEWAVKLVTDTYIATYKTLTDKHLREKYIDLEDVAERLIIALSDDSESEFIIDKDTIIIAKYLHPSNLIKFSKSYPKAIVTETGGWTSHTFILARELNIPAVTGVRNVFGKVENNEDIIVDGFNGKIILRPKEKKLNQYQINENKFIERNNKTLTEIKESTKTLDGFEVTLRTNLDITIKYDQAKKQGAKGIGLYRSEYLYSKNNEFPNEEEQYEIYRGLGEIVGFEGIRIRTFDLGIGEITNDKGLGEKNPALGLTGIRLSQKLEKDFRNQIRAIIRAAYTNQIDIILPMVSDVSEITWAKKIIADEKNNLDKINKNYGNPQIGAMIETPSAVFIIDQILHESDFISVGTNDLVQYILAVDRDNEVVSDHFRTLHPAILKALRIIFEASKKYNKKVIICGEMAGSPLYIPILIAFGANELSMSHNSISKVHKIISSISREDSIQLVGELEKCRSADEVENLTKKLFKKKWSHLYQEFIYRH